MAYFHQFPIFGYTLKWFVLSLVIGSIAGCASAFFLISLDWVTNYREANTWIIFLLPAGGLVVGLTYHYFGTSVLKGTNLLLEEFHEPKQVIPIKMAPLVLFGTLVTHLFGGSAGREGTAVQMGGAIADQFSRLFNITSLDRKIIIVTGISAGFASVFGTPLAGAVFALEVLILGRMRYEAILPSFLAAIFANYVCDLWPVTHTTYSIDLIPEMNPINLLWTILVGVLFGLTALLFSKSTHFWTANFVKLIKYPPFRPVVGGLIIAIAFYFMNDTRYLGLGIPVIQNSFLIENSSFDFLLKILFTSFTLGAGFKGGEVTPLFFIGATLGNALIWFIPLPLALLAGMGFVAVFSGATNTPIACTLMGVELFGMESALYIAVACVVAYLFSGHNGIYSSQLAGSPKHGLLNNIRSQETVKNNTDKEVY